MVKKCLKEGIDYVAGNRDPKGVVRHDNIIQIPSTDEWIEVGAEREVGAIMKDIGERWVTTGDLTVKG